MHPRHLFVTFTNQTESRPIMTTNTRSLRASQMLITDFVYLVSGAADREVHVVFSETEYALPLVREAIARLVSDPMSGRVQALLTEHAPQYAHLVPGDLHAGSTFSVDNRRRIIRASAADPVQRRVKNNVVMLDARGSNPMQRIVETACFLREGDVLVLTNVGSCAVRPYRNRILDFAETGVLWASGSLSPVLNLPPRVTVVVLEGYAVTSHIDERGMVSSR